MHVIWNHYQQFFYYKREKGREDNNNYNSRVKREKRHYLNKFIRLNFHNQYVRGS